MGLSDSEESSSNSNSKRRSVVVVVINVNNKSSKGNMESLEWALKRVVRPRDTVIALGVLFDFWKKNSCFPFLMGIDISGLWERVDLSGQVEMNPRDLEEEIEEKRGQFHTNLQRFYPQCKKNVVKLEVKLAAGIRPSILIAQEARDSNCRWLVIHSHFKKYKEHIPAHVNYNVAIVKGKDVATIMTSKATYLENSDAAKNPENYVVEEGESSATQVATENETESPCWCPLSWRSGFPRAFSETKLAVITNGFADGNVVMSDDGMKVYRGTLQEAPVSVRCFSENDERFWSMLKILSRVRHRNILNLVGYCCTGPSVFLLSDHPCRGSVEMNLECDSLARGFGWKARWAVALEIGGSLRYLHEECVDGPIVNLSVCSSFVVFSHSYSAMLGNLTFAKWITDDVPSKDDSPAENPNPEQHHCYSMDVYDYGMFLVELITGKSARCFQAQDKGQSLIDWAVSLLENGSFSQLMDPRYKAPSWCYRRNISFGSSYGLCCIVLPEKC